MPLITNGERGKIKTADILTHVPHSLDTVFAMRCLQFSEHARRVLIAVLFQKWTQNKPGHKNP